MPAQQIIRVIATQDTGVTTMDFENTAKGRSASLKFLQQLRATHAQHKFFTHPLNATYAGDVKQIEKDKKYKGWQNTAERKEALAKVEKQLQDGLLREGIVKPTLAVVTEVIAGFIPAAPVVPKWDKPRPPAEQCHAALDHLLGKGRPLDVLRTLEALADPFVARELDRIIDLKDMM